MAQKPIAMEQLKQILQLKNDGISIREMARRTGISRNSVRKYLQMLAKVPDGSEDRTDKAIADCAYGSDSLVHDYERLQQLFTHFGYARTELTRTGVTRQLHWQEYIEQHPDGYVYSHFFYHLIIT